MKQLVPNTLYRQHCGHISSSRRQSGPADIALLFGLGSWSPCHCTRPTLPEAISWSPPILDLHGRYLTPPGFAPVSPGARVFEAGVPFEVDERAEPHLALFCKQARQFRRA